MVEYRLQWDSIIYQPGELKVVAYKNGKRWAEETEYTCGAAAKILLQADREIIAADGKDLPFVTLQIVDAKGNLVPYANNNIEFSISGPADIIATDNGNPADLEALPSNSRNAFNGLALAIIRSKRDQHGKILVTARSGTLIAGIVAIRAN